VIFAGRFVGMKNQEVKVTGARHIRVTMVKDMKELDDVIVRRLAIAHPVLMSCQLINEKIVRQWSVWLTFMQIIFPLPFSDSGKSGRMD
jgi:hypothetical protein